MILNQAQAEAVYSAMCALNNVGGKANNLHVGRAVVSADVGSAIHVYSPEADERYPNQSAFAAAYGLN